MVDKVSDFLNTGDRSYDDPSPADDTRPLHNAADNGEVDAA